MKQRLIFVILAIYCASAAIVTAAEPQSTRKERNLILKANNAFNEKDYQQAIKLYNEALEENPMSERAKYNLAVSMLKQADEKGGASGNSNTAQPDSASITLKHQADSIFRELYETGSDNMTKEKAIYNSGNLLFSENQYAMSIEQYKKALRLNPNNNNARHNLRLAQLKLQEQQQNQDQQDQKQDEKEQEEKDKKEQQQQPPQQPEQQPQQPQQQKPKQSNAENILNAVQQNEDKTRERLEKQQQPVGSRYHEKPW